MSIAQFLNQLKKEGILIQLLNSDLKIKSLNKKIPSDTIKILRERKLEIINFLIDLEEGTDFNSILPSEKKEYYPLSSAQLRMYLLQQLDLKSTFYNNGTGLIKLPDDITTEKIISILQKLIDRHESFKTCFIEHNNVPVQKICTDVRIDIVKVSTTYDKLNEVQQKFIKPFNLENAPAMRALIVKLEDNDIFLLVDMHHIISDATTRKILKDEFVRLNLNEKLLPLPLQYKDYSNWQNSEKRKKNIENQKAYWVEDFSDTLPILNLPLDYSRPAVQSFEGSGINFSLTKQESLTVKEFSKSNDITFFMTLISAYVILVNKLSNQEDIIIGTPVSGRSHADLEKIVGMFVNTLPIRCNVKKEFKVKELIEIIRAKSVKAFDNQDFQFEQLIKEIDYKRDTSRNPVFDIAFSYVSGESNEIEKEEIQSEIIENTSDSSKFDLMLTISDTGDYFLCNFEYCTKLFRSETIKRFVGYFKRVLKELTSDPEKIIANIDILSLEERNRQLFDYNSTSMDYPKEKCIHELFEEQVRRTPNNIALITENRKISYEEFNSLANQLALRLLEFDITPGTIIALMLSRSLEMMIGIMGILKAGGAYLPIDPEYPKDRISYILKDSKAKVFVTQKRIKDEIQHTLPEIIIETELHLNKEYPNLKNRTTSKDLSYIIYTSGSTGEPKGVMIEHHSVINRLKWMQKMYPIGTGDTLIQKTPYTFDVSVWELFWWSFEGSSLYLLEKDGEKDPSKIANAIEENKVNVIHFVPSMLEMFLEHIKEQEQSKKLKSLQYVFASGEELKVNYVNKFYNILGEQTNCMLVNLYGPTEATVDVTYFNCQKEINYNNIPIGKPIFNTQVYILDSDNKLLPEGVTGELCLAGAGLSRGYLGKDSLTKEKFINHPFVKGEKLYRTGDLVRWLPDGNIEYIGRIDNQVKIRGFRIELGEIEKLLINNDKVREAVVIAHGDESLEKYLCAYVVGEDSLNEKALKNYLETKLPDYMIPQAIMFLENLPITKNGKLDRNSLPIPNLTDSSDIILPSTELEKQLAEIWAEILNIEIGNISINSNFLEIGGNSLKIIMLKNYINKVFNKEIPILELFNNNTIEKISELLKQSGRKEYLDLKHVEKKEYYKLSSSQKRLFYLQNTHNDSRYNLNYCYKVEGELNKEKLVNAFRKLIDRHQQLKTRFCIWNNEIIQSLCDNAEFSVTHIKTEDSQFENTISEFISVFNLEEAPLFKVGIIDVENLESYMIFDIHHIITDGVSIEVLVNEFVDIYNGGELSPLKMSYFDYTEWQQDQLNKTDLLKQENYWMERIGENIPPLALIPDTGIENVDESKPGIITSIIEKQFFSDLKKYINETNSTLNSLLLTVFYVVLYKTGGINDIIVGTVTSGRTHFDIKEIFGLFINTIALRNFPSGEKTFNKFLNEVQENTLQDLDNQDYPFDLLIEKLNKKGIRNSGSMFSVFFTLFNIERKDSTIEGLQLIPIEIGKSNSKFDLVLYAGENPNKVVLNFKYDVRVFSDQTVNNIRTSFLSVLTQVIENRNILLSDIKIKTSVVKAEKSMFQLNNEGFNF